MTEEISGLNETQIFQGKRDPKSISMTYVLVSIGTFVWLLLKLPKEFLHGWLGISSAYVGGFIILVIFFVAFNSLIVSYSQILINQQYISLKTPLRIVTIPWDAVLGVRIFADGKCFRIVGMQNSILFNATDYVNSTELLEILKAKLQPISNRPLPSSSDDVLLNTINLVLGTYPEASHVKVFTKIRAFDREIKIEKVKQLVKSLRSAT